MKKKLKAFELSTGIAIASLLMSIISVVWIGGFRMSTLIHEVIDLKEDVQQLEDRMNVRFEKIENRLDRIEDNLHEMDVRVTTVEQRKH